MCDNPRGQVLKEVPFLDQQTRDKLSGEQLRAKQALQDMTNKMVEMINRATRSNDVEEMEQMLGARCARVCARASVLARRPRDARYATCDTISRTPRPTERCAGHCLECADERLKSSRKRLQLTLEVVKRNPRRQRRREEVRRH